MNTNWLKRLGVVLLATLGGLSVLISLLAKQMVSGFVDGGAELIINYYDIISESGNLAGDIELIRALVLIDKYSHIIITVSFIWMFVLLYVWQAMRKKSSDNKQKRND